MTMPSSPFASSEHAILFQMATSDVLDQAIAADQESADATDRSSAFCMDTENMFVLDFFKSLLRLQ